MSCSSLSKESNAPQLEHNTKRTKHMKTTDHITAGTRIELLMLDIQPTEI